MTQTHADELRREAERLERSAMFLTLEEGEPLTQRAWSLRKEAQEIEKRLPAIEEAA